MVDRRTIRESAVWKVLDELIEERVKFLTKNVLTFGIEHDKICFNQGKILALQQLQKWVAEDDVEPQTHDEGV